jgi:hypothetical protein
MKCLFSDENLLAIAQRFHSVANIDLSNFQSVGLTDNSICRIVADSPGLVTADFSFCSSLSEVTLYQLGYVRVGLELGLGLGRKRSCDRTDLTISGKTMLIFVPY